MPRFQNSLKVRTKIHESFTVTISSLADWCNNSINTLKIWYFLNYDMKMWYKQTRKYDIWYWKIWNYDIFYFILSKFDIDGFEILIFDIDPPLPGPYMSNYQSYHTWSMWKAVPFEISLLCFKSVSVVSLDSETYSTSFLVSS